MPKPEIEMGSGAQVERDERERKRAVGNCQILVFVIPRGGGGHLVALMDAWKEARIGR